MRTHTLTQTVLSAVSHNSADFNFSTLSFQLFRSFLFDEIYQALHCVILCRDILKEARCREHEKETEGRVYCVVTSVLIHEELIPLAVL